MSGSAASASSPRIFVSHSHEDDEYCRAFVDELRRLCGDRDAVWYDEHNLTSGELMREIQRHLHQRLAFVVIFTQASLRRSQWVADECAWAYQLYRAEPGRTLLPVVGGAIERGDFIPDWLYLEGFRRIEAPGMQPYPPVEAAYRAYAALAGTQVAAAPASMPGKPEPAPAPIQPQSAHTSQQRPTSVAVATPVRPILPRERFTERLERLGFVAQVTTDPDTGNKTTFIRPPLCRVSEGPFLMGSTPRQDIDAYDDEKPQITVDLPAYQIARFPVTVAEYACFVETGHLAPAGWDTLQRNLDHPIVNVSWYDARDYAAWLAALTGEPWKLPSEAEWEKAARWDPKGNGGRGLSRIYPWGKDFDARRCNTSAFTPTIGTMTPVGTCGPEQAARDGSSPYGVQDMAGTVWEWTRTIYDAQAYSKKTFRDGTNSAENRVQRGGSYGDPAFRVARGLPPRQPAGLRLRLRRVPRCASLRGVGSSPPTPLPAERGECALRQAADRLYWSEDMWCLRDYPRCFRPPAAPTTTHAIDTVRGAAANGRDMSRPYTLREREEIASRMGACRAPNEQRRA